MKHVSSAPGHNKTSMIRRGVIALAVLPLIGAACSGSDSDTATTDTAPTDVDATTPVEDIATDSLPADTGPVTSESGSPVVPPSDGVAPAPNGFVFVSPEGDYAITFPGEPTSTPLPVALPTGQVTAEAFIYEDGTDAAYFTSVFEYEEGTTDADPEVVLTGARDGAVTNVNGTLVESEFVEVDGVPGVSFSFTVAGGEGNALVYVDGARLYQSFALGGIGQTASFTAFLDSFTFTSSTAAGDS